MDPAPLPWPRRTERLVLRAAEPEDLPAVFAIRSQPQVGEWMPDRPTSYDAWVLSQGRRGGLAPMVVVLRDEVVIGHLHLFIQDAWAQQEALEPARGAQAEIGWVFDPAHQGQGLATEAVRELVRVCFEDLGVRRLIAVAFADNHASVRVMQKLGMRLEARMVKESLHRDLGWLDSVTYALLAEEWRA